MAAYPIWKGCPQPPPRLPSFIPNMTDHALEKSWWLDNPPQLDHLPSSSLMSFAKLSSCTSNKQLRCPTAPPQFCIIQIGFSRLYLYAKWMPLMMLIQLIQASALDASISASRALKKKSATNLLRLTWFFDFLLQKFAQEARDKLMISQKNVLPEGWMPDSMHRCLTRMELDVTHSPTSLDKHGVILDKAYKNHQSHFSYGVQPAFYLLHDRFPYPYMW